MFSSLTRFFCKTADCPTSEALLAYRSSLVAPGILSFIESHLASCDFCGAELQLLTHCDIGSEEYSFAEMPEHLRRLAESLLKIDPFPFAGGAELAEPNRVSH
jgi:hypothetical protein